MAVNNAEQDLTGHETSEFRQNITRPSAPERRSSAGSGGGHSALLLGS